MATMTPTVAWVTGRRAALPTDARFFIPHHDRPAWPETELDRRAQDLATIHRPDQDPLRWRRRWGVLPWPGLEEPRCVFCGRAWLCPPAAWAHAQLSAHGHNRREHLSEEAP
ncbi:hypothetical protein HEB94_007625 [Actinopolymorpha pittospori]|jgi:hypothetical protein|uniref:Uncharacterized protein n=1 Tax=Actinopolymorpha pittospori TaxID=648752 RepID=A0A927N2Y6_9ACTN|nr:hypothetical protein [Actinopolymorpha pittospori]